MNKSEIKQAIKDGKTYLGIELGSTRIKGVLIDESFTPIAGGSHEWENRLVDGIWTYSIEDVWEGIRDCYANLVKDVEKNYSEQLVKLGGIGISAMMHGYMPFNKEGEIMVPFRTWRNTITEEASEKLTELFKFHIPQRWSIAHL
ncbi:MAG: ATPase, partial [Lachnospiraceae bacterium]|nr:ATPase [Lachnospiraceae bacterium]